MTKKHKRVYRTITDATELFTLLKLTKSRALVGCLSNGMVRCRFTPLSCNWFKVLSKCKRYRNAGRCRSADAVSRPKKAEFLCSLRWRPMDDVGWNASPLILLAYEASRFSE